MDAEGRRKINYKQAGGNSLNDEDFLKLECDDGHTSPRIYQKPSNYTLTTGEFYDM